MFLQPLSVSQLFVPIATGTRVAFILDTHGDFVSPSLPTLAAQTANGFVTIPRFATPTEKVTTRRAWESPAWMVRGAPGIETDVTARSGEPLTCTFPEDGRQLSLSF